MRTVTARIRGVKSELEDLGETMEDEVNTVPKYRAKLLALSGVDILEADQKTFRSTYQILDDLSAKWQDLTDVQRSAITEMLAGTRQQNVFSSIMSEFDEARNVMASMTDATGALDRAQSTYIDNIQGRTEQLKASFTDLANSLIHSDIVKWFITAGKNIIEYFIKPIMTGAENLAPKLALVSASALALFKVFKSLKTTFGNAATIIKSLGKGWEALHDAMVETNTISKKTTTAMMQSNIYLAGAALILTGIVTAISYARQHAEDLRKEAEKDGEAFEENAQSIDEYKSRITELRTALDSGNLSEEEAYKTRVELVGIQDEVCDKLGLEKDAFDVLAGSINDATGALDTYNQKSAQATLTKNRETYDKAIGSIEGFSWRGSTGDYANSARAVAQRWEYMSDGLRADIIDLLSKYETISQASGVLSIAGNAIEAQDEVESLMADLYDLQDAVEKTGSVSDNRGLQDFIDQVVSASGQIDKILETYRANYDYATTLTIAANSKYSTIVNDIETANKAIKDAVASEDDEALEAAYGIVRKISAAIRKEDFSDDPNVRIFIDNLFAELQSFADQQTIKIRVGASLDASPEIKNTLARAAGVIAGPGGVLTDAELGNARIDYEQWRAGNGDLTASVSAYSALASAAEQYGTTVDGLVGALSALGIVSTKTGSAVSAGLGTAVKGIDALKTSVESAVSVTGTLQTTLESGTEISEETYKAIADLVGGEDKLADSIDTTNGYVITNVDKLRDLIGVSKTMLRRDLELAKGHKRLDYKGLVNALADVVDSTEEYTDEVEDAVEAARDNIRIVRREIDQYSMLEEQLRGTTDAFTNFTAAQEFDAATDYRDDIAAMIEAFNAGYASGEFGSEAFRTAMEALVPQSVLDDAEDRIEAARDYIDNVLSDFYTLDGDKISVTRDNVIAFVNKALVTPLAEGGTVFEGTLDDFTINPALLGDWDALADALGMTTAEVFALSNAITTYTRTDESFVTMMNTDTTTVGKFEQEVQAATEAYADLLSERAAMLRSGDTESAAFTENGEAIAAAREALNEYGDAAQNLLDTVIENNDAIEAQRKVLSDLETRMKAAPGDEILRTAYLAASDKLTTLLDQREELGEPTQMTIQLAIDNVDAQIAALETRLGEIATKNSDGTWTADFGFEAQVSEAVAQLEELTGDKAKYEAYVGLDDRDLLKAIEPIQDFIGEVDGQQYKFTVSLSNYNVIKNQLQTIRNYIEELRRSGDIPILTGAANAGGNNNGRKTGGARAAGTLVGELGRELVVDPHAGTYSTVGDNGAEMVNLPDDAIVFNHEQTEQLLRNGRISGRGRALAGGNAYADHPDQQRFDLRPIGNPVNPLVVVQPAAKTFDEEMKELEHELNMKKITYEKYVEELIRIRDEYFKTVTDENRDDYLDLIEKIFDSEMQLYEEHRNDLEQEIDVWGFLYEKAVRGLDYDGMSESLRKQYELYQRIMDDAHAEADRLRALGVDETDDTIQELQKTWRDASDAQRDILDKMASDIVSTFSDALSEVKNIYDTLKQAAEDFAENGYMSIETFQEIMEFGPKYLKYLYDENGQVKVNEESIKALVAAKINDLAISKALTLLDLVKQNKDNAQALNELADASVEASDATWDLVKAQLAALGLDPKLYNAFLGQIEAIRIMAESAKDGIGKAGEDLKDYYEDASDALDSILDYTMDLIRYEKEQEKEALRKQIEDYKAIIDAKKESLRITKEELGYQDEVSEKLDKISRLQDQINELRFDDSREAAAKRASLEEELADLQKDLADTQADYAYDSQTDALDKMADAYEEEKEAEIKIVEDSVSSTEKVYRLAIARLEKDFEGTMKQVIAWNIEAGSTLDSEMQKAWANALTYVKEYGSYLAAVEEIQNRIAAYDAGSGKSGTEVGNTIAGANVGSGAAGGTQGVTGAVSGAAVGAAVPRRGTADRDEQAVGLVQQMKDNDDRARNARMTLPEAQWRPINEQVYEENKALAQQISALTGRPVTFDKNKGWMYNGTPLFDYFSKLGVYHKGGYVGGGKGDEELAVLQKGEFVLTDEQQRSVGRAIDLSGFILEKASAISRLFGGASKLGAIEDFFSAAARAASMPGGTAAKNEQVFAPVVNVSISHNGEMTDGDAQRYGEIAANAVLDRLNGAFTKRGVTTLRGAALKA